MKFICENCKAKYQIGDDKIAGRSVRMKCRRCGHEIHVTASQIEGDRAVEGPTFTGTIEPLSSITPQPGDILSLVGAAFWGLRLALQLAVQPRLLLSNEPRHVAHLLLQGVLHHVVPLMLKLDGVSCGCHCT